MDYFDFSGTILVSPQVSAEVTIEINDDSLVEGLETFELSLQLAEGDEGAPVLLQPATATVTIFSDDREC